MHKHVLIGLVAVMTAAGASARTVYDAGKALRQNCVGGGYANPYTDQNGGVWSYRLSNENANTNSSPALAYGTYTYFGKTLAGFALEKISSETLKKPLVVAFDEFQEIARLSRDVPLEGVFRSCIQAHQNVRYLFLGSKTHLLKRMFGDKSRPFYKSATTIRLPKPPFDESVAFVKTRFASCQVGVDDAVAVRIVDEASNIPYYVQQLSSLVFDDLVEAGRDWVENSDIEKAVADLVSENSDYYAERMAAFSSSQRVVISAIARESVSDFSEAYRRRHSLGVSSTVHAALNVVVNAGVVERGEEGYQLEDPFFARVICACPGSRHAMPQKRGEVR